MWASWGHSENSFCTTSLAPPIAPAPAAPFVRCSPPADTLLTQRRAAAQRVVSTPRGKAYGILSVVSQLYGSPRIAFKIPPTVFQPQPDVDSALIVVDFPEERPRLGINECHLRTVLRAAFQMRRKMLRQVPRPAPAPLRPRTGTGRRPRGAAPPGPKSARRAIVPAARRLPRPLPPRPPHWFRPRRSRMCWSRLAAGPECPY